MLVGNLFDRVEHDDERAYLSTLRDLDARPCALELDRTEARRRSSRTSGSTSVGISTGAGRVHRPAYAESRLRRLPAI
jgi:hypothetical protein